MANHLYDLLASRFPWDRAKPCFLLKDGKPISYATLERRAGRAAAALIAKGIAPGDRVAMQAEKSPEGVMLYLACVKAGAVFLPLNTAYTRG